MIGRGPRRTAMSVQTNAMTQRATGTSETIKPPGEALQPSASSIHRLELIDQAFDDFEPHGPELRVGGVETERLEQLLVMLGAARREHVEIAVGEPLVGLLVDRIERVHQAIAEGIGVDIKRRMDEVRDIDPEIFIAGLEIDGRSEALALHLEPDLA